MNHIITCLKPSEVAGFSRQSAPVLLDPTLGRRADGIVVPTQAPPGAGGARGGWSTATWDDQPWVKIPTLGPA